MNELKLFSAFNEDVFNDLTKLLTLDDFRENKLLAGYTNATMQDRIWWLGSGTLSRQMLFSIID